MMGGGLVIFFPPDKMCSFLNKKNWEKFGNFCFSSANSTNFAYYWKNCHIFYITNLEEKKTLALAVTYSQQMRSYLRYLRIASSQIVGWIC